MKLSFAADETEYEVSIEPEGVIQRRRWRGEEGSTTETLAQAFLRGFWRLSAPPALAFAGHRHLAELLDPATLPSPVDRDRVQFIRRYDPARLAPWEFSWSRREDNGKPDSVLDLSLVPEGLWGATPGESSDSRKFHLPDEAYFLGPIEHGMPFEGRQRLLGALRSALGPGATFASGEGFPLLDHARIERRQWTWNERSNGNEDAFVAGSHCVVGYQFAQDYGYGYWSVERAATDGAWVLMTATPEIRAEVAAHILGARAG